MEGSYGDGDGAGIQWRISCHYKSGSQCWGQSARFLCLSGSSCPRYPSPCCLSSRKVSSFSFYFQFFLLDFLGFFHFGLHLDIYVFFFFIVIIIIKMDRKIS